MQSFPALHRLSATLGSVAYYRRCCHAGKRGLLPPLLPRWEAWPTTTTAATLGSVAYYIGGFHLHARNFPFHRFCAPTGNFTAMRR